MKVLRKLEVPTGYIMVVQGEKGPLELVSLGDYGKDKNIFCRALGLDRPLEKVEHGKLMPLEKKWVVTVSTQYGCGVGCSFCDVPKVGRGVNVNEQDILDQIGLGLSVNELHYTERLNIHFARMGEPMYNWAVIRAAMQLKKYLYKCRFYPAVTHPVVSTMCPVVPWFESYLHSWMMLKNGLFEGEAGLQLSINSTSDKERRTMFGGNSMSIEAIGSAMLRVLNDLGLSGRKITLNFAVAGWEIDPEVLLRWFSPEQFVIKLTPMHKTQTALEGKIQTEGDYTTMEPYQEIEKRLSAAGYDVLVFIASREEDLGRITCGNAILSGTLPEVPYTEVPL